MATAAQFCGLLLLPERTDACNAVARFIGKIRLRHGHQAPDIARQLKRPDGNPPNVDTILRAERGETLLSFDLIAQLVAIYSDCADPILTLLGSAMQPVTLEQRLARDR